MKARASNRGRGAHKGKAKVFIGVWVPDDWIPRIDSVVENEDIDRSKLLRRALEEKLQRA